MLHLGNQFAQVMMIRKPRFPSELLDESDEDDPVFPDADPAAVAEYVRHKQGQQAVLHKQVNIYIIQDVVFLSPKVPA